MIRSKTLDPVEYLVARRFPWCGAVLENRPLTLHPRPGLSADTRQRLFRAVEEYRAELLAKEPAELHALFEQEQDKEREALQLKAELEERERFFNQPRATADFTHWSKAPYWTLEEALALAFGKAPEIVSWRTVEPHVLLLRV